MKKNLAAQLIFRAAFITVAVLAFFISIGVWNIGGVSKFNPFFFTDYFNWTIVITIVASTLALIDNVRSLLDGAIRAFPSRGALIKFTAASSCLFCFILGAFFVVRVGNSTLVDGVGYGAIYLGFLTYGFWTDLSVFLPRFIVPVAYFVGYVVFEERLKTRGIYSTLGLIFPTIFYFTDMFFGLIMGGVYGGAEALTNAGMYGIAYPYFFYDSVTYSGWWWILIWPTIFGVSLMVLNNIVFRISRVMRDENGKLRCYTKIKPDEDGMCDFLHGIIIRRAAKKTASDK